MEEIDYFGQISYNLPFPHYASLEVNAVVVTEPSFDKEYFQIMVGFLKMSQFEIFQTVLIYIDIITFKFNSLQLSWE